MKNQAFLRAVNCLSHPVSIGAIFLLLLNDQVLRRAWPSWWTGKLGDFAWLIFVPFIVVAILAWMVPFRLKHRKETIGLLAFALTGVWFALAKTVPAVHDVTVRCFETITGWKASLLLDPTDLMALTALSIGWYVWRHKQVRPLKISRTVWPVLALASLAMVADAAAPDVGIECLERRDSRLIAFSKYFGTYSQVFSSDDGGLSWQEAPSYRDSQLECTGHDHSWQVGDDTGRIQYLFEPGIGISSSEDSGKTWKRVVDLAGREARDAYYVHSRPNSWSISGPSDALIHDSTGNLVVAMGQDGVLVRTSDAQWRWVSVGPYRHEELNRIDQIWTLIYGEFWLSVLFALLLVSMLVLRIGKARIAHIILAVLAWGCWVGAVIASPALLSGYANVLLLLIPACALLALPLVLDGAWRLARRSLRIVIQAGVTAVTGIFVFLLPYILWSQGAIPHYRTAMIIALVLAVTASVVEFWYVRRSWNTSPEKSAGPVYG